MTSATTLELIHVSERRSIRIQQSRDSHAAFKFLLCSMSRSSSTLLGEEVIAGSIGGL
jgi:hypothetical protein